MGGGVQYVSSLPLPVYAGIIVHVVKETLMVEVPMTDELTMSPATTAF